jgi:serine/arginine repetitive matrix protein 2
MSYNGIGLQTARGSGTNGYVQRSLANIRNKTKTPYSRERELDKPRTKTRRANPEIMEHDRKREIEVRCLELQDKLEEEGYIPYQLILGSAYGRLDEEEIEKKVALLRKELTSQTPVGHDVKSYVHWLMGLMNRLKPHQVHDLAAAKEKEMEKVRRAFGIRKDYVEGDGFKQMREKRPEDGAVRP